MKIKNTNISALILGSAFIILFVGLLPAKENELSLKSPDGKIIVTVHAAETSVERLLEEHLPRLLRAAGEVSAEWALWQSRPHVEVPRRADARSATA